MDALKPLALLIVIILSSGCLEGDVIRPSNQTIYNNYTNGSGGVSFNGSAVDGNGSSLYNFTNLAGTFNHSNLTRLNWSESGHTSDDSKVNDFGDNMTGLLNMMKKNISNMSYTFSEHYIVINKDGNTGSSVIDYMSTDGIWNDDPKSTIGGSDYVFQLTAINNSASGTFTSFSNDSADEGSVFSAIRGRGTPEKPSYVQTGDRLFWIGGRGVYWYPATSVWTVSASKATIKMLSTEDWTNTKQGTKMTFGVTTTGTTTRTDTLVLENATARIPPLAGSGYRVACFYPDGTLYAGTVDTLTGLCNAP